MLRKGIIERREEKLKPRGKPFPKDNFRGKPKGKVLAAPRCESGVEGGIVVPSLESTMQHCANAESGGFIDVPQEFVEAIINNLKEPMNITDEILKENMNTPNKIATRESVIKLEETKVDPVTEEAKELELIESLDFMNGPNKLSIRFSKKHNRMFRIQIFLNDEHEVRPVTYSGASTGVTFWNLLKGVLRK
jgi:hypothetical protein